MVNILRSIVTTGDLKTSFHWHTQRQSGVLINHDRYRATGPDCHPTHPWVNGKEKDMDKVKIEELLKEHLSGAYFCTRCWSAWGYGTMSQMDFDLVAEDDDFISELADAIMKMGGKENV